MGGGAIQQPEKPMTNELDTLRTIAIIAAVAANGAIGFKGGIPWDSPEDRAIFARKTANGVLVCGRHTAAALLNPITDKPNGRTLVCIENGRFEEFAPGFDAWGSSWIEIAPYSIEAVGAHYPDRNIWVCGGSRLYAEAMRNPLVTEMHITHMDGHPDADTFFPRFDTSGGLRGIVAGGSRWDVVSTVDGKGFSHRVYRRI
jgi:dihydrofolate reductase